MTMAPWAVMLGFVGTYTRVENVICDHQVAYSGNWEGDFRARLAFWVGALGGAYLAFSGGSNEGT